MSLISVSNVRIFCQNNYVEVLETGKLFINIENFLSIVMFVILQSETFISSVSSTQRNCVLKIIFLQVSQKLSGSRLLLESVSRRDSGEYECVASNGVEEDHITVSSVIRLTVHCKKYVSKIFYLVWEILEYFIFVPIKILAYHCWSRLSLDLLKTFWCLCLLCSTKLFQL